MTKVMRIIEWIVFGIAVVAASLDQILALGISPAPAIAAQLALVSKLGRNLLALLGFPTGNKDLRSIIIAIIMAAYPIIVEWQEVIDSKVQVTLPAAAPGCAPVIHTAQDILDVIACMVDECGVDIVHAKCMLADMRLGKKIICAARCIADYGLLQSVDIECPIRQVH
ncbi:MAG: hypothetical protein QXP01_09635 [Candidatus Hadarchaeum sp.]